MFAFSTKYTLALTKRYACAVTFNRTEETFSVEEFREVLSVNPDKLKSFPQFKQSALDPAVVEINALSDFNLEVEALRQGGSQRGRLTGFRMRWEMKIRRSGIE